MNFPPVSPPSAVALGEVGRSMLAAVSLTEGGPEGGDERRLKPWGVAMLPHERPDEPSAPAEAGTRAEVGTGAQVGTRAESDAVAGVEPDIGGPADAKDVEEAAEIAADRAPGGEEEADRREEAPPVRTGRPEYGEPPRAEAPRPDGQRPDGLRPDGQRAEELRAERRSQEQESVPTTAMAERRG